MNEKVYPHLLQLNERAHGSANWAELDFSINTNPLGPPESILELLKQPSQLSWLIKYPEIHSASLKEKLAEKLGVVKEQIVVGNGAAELFFLLPRVLKINSGIVIHPTFGEYEPSLMAANISVKRLTYRLEEQYFRFPMEELEELLSSGDLIYLCRPNNPTGQMVSKEEIENILALAKEKKAYLLVDESFIDFTEKPEGLIRDFPRNNHLILVRSLTKFYTIPGIRLGYMLAPNWLAKSLELARDPWSVNGLAQQIGMLMLEDDKFYDQTRRWIAEERDWVFQQLQTLKNFRVFPSTTNFHLLKFLKEDIYPLMDNLKRKGIALRLANSFYGLDEHFIRLAVKTREENQQLLKELKSFVTEK